MAIVGIGGFAESENLSFMVYSLSLLLIVFGLKVQKK